MSARMLLQSSALIIELVASPMTVWSAESTILFSGKLFVDAGETINVAGTLTGESIAYPNNSYSISCVRSRNECLVASVEQIGPNQIGRVEYPYAMPVVKWTPSQILAAADPSFASCVRDTIMIDRNSQQVVWAQEPINQADAFCSRSDHASHRWMLGDSPGERQLRGK